MHSIRAVLHLQHWFWYQNTEKETREISFA